MESPYIAPEFLDVSEMAGNGTVTPFGMEMFENDSLGLLGSNGLMQHINDICNPFNPNFNCTLQNYLSYIYGPQQLALTVAIPITVVYVMIFVTGFVGNVAVCIVIVRHQSMHTATNYYLFSLAISDLTLLLLGLPNDISYYWHQYPYSLGIGFCKLRALLSEAASYVSVLTIVAFSTERYLAICHPLHLYTMSGLQRPVRIIAALWIISLLCAAPFAMHTTIHYMNYPPKSNNKTLESAFCAMLKKEADWPLYEISSVGFFLLPAAVILVLYARMGLRIRARSKNHLGKGVKGSVHGEMRQARSRKAIIRMLAAVVVAFFVCWAPFHAQRLVYIHGQNWKNFQDINEWMYSIAGWLYYVSSTVNPILYNVMSNRYRVAFRETLCCGRRHSKNGTGFSREQSSFRDTTIATSGEGSHFVRVRSVSSEPLHRSNTTSRLSRNSTLSSTLSKEYNHVNYNVSPKSRWSNDTNASSVKKWNNNDANCSFGTKKQSNQNALKLFSNMETLQTKDMPGSKQRKEITFEKETNNLIFSDNREDYEMNNIKNYGNSLCVDFPSMNTRMPDSRSDSLILIPNKRSSLTCLNKELYKNDLTVDDDSNIAERQVGKLHNIPDSKPDVLVVYGHGPNNGIKRFCPNNGLNKSFEFSSNVTKPKEDAFVEAVCDESTKINESTDVSETCI